MSFKSNKWIRSAPDSHSVYGWGVAVLSSHPVLETATVRLPAGRSCCARRPLSQTAGLHLLHPIFGRVWVFTAHLMADVFGLVSHDTCGSLQLQNLRALLAHIDSHVSPNDCDNVILCGDFNALGGSRVIQTLLGSGGQWGPWIDCALAVGSISPTQSQAGRVNFPISQF